MDVWIDSQNWTEEIWFAIAVAAGTRRASLLDLPVTVLELAQGGNASIGRRDQRLLALGSPRGRDP
jgi:hypothetical protein